MLKPGPFYQRDREWHPPAHTPDYKTSVSRSPQYSMISLENNVSEITGPTFGHNDIDPLDKDLIYNYAKAGESAIGERIIRGDGASTLDVYRNPSCTGDVNGDLVVDILDLLEVISQWGPCGGGCTADIDDDGKVDILDLLEVIGAWGACSSK